MGRLKLTLLVGLAVAAAACSGSALPDAAPTAAAGKSGAYRFAVSGGVNVRDVPFQMALESLQGQGYTVERVELAESPLVTTALLSADADLGSVGVAGVWSAVAEDGDLRTIISAGANTWSIVTRNGIDTCSDLHGVGVGFFATQGVTPSLFAKYVQENCPGVEPVILVIGNSATRQAALLAGEIDAALLEVEDVLEVERQAPGEFHVLINFTDIYRDIFVSAFHVRRAWAEQHPEMVQDFIRAQLIAQRQINADIQLLQDGIVKYQELDADAARQTAEAYLNPTIWDPNGAMTLENVQFNLDFLASIDTVPAGLRAQDVADLSYLNVVLDEIGRQ